MWKFAEGFQNKSLTELEQALRANVSIPFKWRDRQGRQIVYTSLGNHKKSTLTACNYLKKYKYFIFSKEKHTEKFSLEDAFRAGVYSILLISERKLTQLNGTVQIIDMSGAVISDIVRWAATKGMHILSSGKVKFWLSYFYF